MSEKWYVVSESELERLVEEAIENYINPDQRERGRLREAEAACRAREVRFIGAADQGNSLMLWGEVKKSDSYIAKFAVLKSKLEGK